jgi:hypothetical protein
MTIRIASLLASGVLIWASSVAAQEDAEPAAPKTAAELRLERLQNERAIAEAEKAIRDARDVAIPSSGNEGTTSAGDGAGQPEALALASRQFDQIAQRIAGRPALQNVSVLVTSGTTRPTTEAYQSFLGHVEALKAELDEAQRSAKEIENAGRSNIVGSTPVAAIVPVASALLSYLRSDYDIAGVDVHGLDDAALIAALVAQGEHKLQPLDQAAISTTTRSELRTILNSLQGSRRSLNTALGRCDELRADRDVDLSEAKDEEKPAVRRRYIVPLGHCATVEAAEANYAQFLSTYSTADGAAMKAVFEQAQLDAALKRGGLLYVKVHQTAGAAYTQANFFASLGAMPYHVTVASVVSWQFVGSDGQVADAGFERVYDGYRRIDQVDELLNPSASQ